MMLELLTGFFFLALAERDLERFLLLSIVIGSGYSDEKMCFYLSIPEEKPS
jgi:hypothetical protein